jgi:two-component system, chemotaxis family, response regulator Rcp1
MVLRKNSSTDHRKYRAVKNILMIDDNEADSFLVAEAIAICDLKARLHTAENAVLAYSFLRKEGPFSTAPTPDLILLDLSMPVINGTQVLDFIKKNRVWKDIPIVVLTSSMREEDVKTCYQMRANYYIVKPTLFDQYIRLAKQILGFLTEKKPIGNELGIRVLTPWNIG